MRWAVGVLLASLSWDAVAAPCGPGDAEAPVIVAIDYIPEGHLVTEDDLYAVMWPCSMYGSGFFNNPALAVGHRIEVFAHQDTVLTVNHFKGDGRYTMSMELPNNARGMEVTLSADSTIPAAGIDVDIVSLTPQGEPKCALQREIRVLRSDPSASPAVLLLSVWLEQVPLFMADYGNPKAVALYEGQTSTLPSTVPDCTP